MTTTLIYIWACLAVACTLNISDVLKSERKLLDYVLQDVDRRTRPSHDISRAVDVIVDMWPVNIEDLNERSQVLYLLAWIKLEWQDEYIHWDPADWGGQDTLIVPSKLLWKPDIVIRNSGEGIRGEVMDEDDKFRFIVSSNGTVSLWTSGRLVTSCRVNMKYFPFDDQACYVHLDSWTYAGNQIRLLNESDKMNRIVYRESGQWDLMDTEILWAAKSFSDSPVFYEIKFVLYMRRKPMYFVTNLLLPSCLLSFLLIPVFLLPPESGEKVSLAITLLLSFSVFQLLIADSMPKTSGAIPLLGIYVLCTMALAALSLLCSVVVLAIHHHDGRRPIPACLAALTRVLSKMVCVRKINVPNPDSKKSRLSSAKNGGNLSTASANEDNGDGYPVFVVGKRCHGDMGDGYDQDSHEQKDDANDFRRFRASRQHSATSPLSEDWTYVAKVLDRLFLIMFFVISVVIAVSLIGIYPMTRPDRPTILEG